MFTACLHQKFYWDWNEKDNKYSCWYKAQSGPVMVDDNYCEEYLSPIRK